MKKIIFAIKHPIKTLVYIKDTFCITVKGILWLDITDKWERCYIDYNNIDYNKFDMYQKSHFKRYEFTKSYIKPSDVVWDIACWTWYGSAILSTVSYRVDWYDISQKVVQHNKNKYIAINNLTFLNYDLLQIQLDSIYNKIISFETIEHIDSASIIDAFKVFYMALKNGGSVYFSVPYMQEDSQTARELWFHKTFYINEEMITKWLSAAWFVIEEIFYQNYDTHEIKKHLEKKDFIICIAKKNA